MFDTMFSMMGAIAFFAFLLAAITTHGGRSKKRSLIGLTVVWTGTLWILVFGAMFANEFLRAAGAPNIRIFQSGAWQPLGPMVMGLILLIVWWRRPRSNSE